MSTFDAYFSKGLELYENKEYTLAIKAFKLALEQSNAQNYANYNLALAYQQINDADNAKKCYELFLKEFPNDQSSLYNIALIHFDYKEYDDACKYFHESFEIKPDKLTVKAITQSYIYAQKTDELYKFIDKIFSDLKYDKILAYDIAKEIEEVAPKVKNRALLDKSFEIYLKLFEIFPHNFAILITISLEYSKKGDWDNAILYCQKALVEEPNSFNANNQMGLIYYCCEDYKRSITYYEKAFKINSKTEPKIYSNLAYAYEKTGRYEDALKLLKDLIIKFPNYPEKDVIKKQARKYTEKLKKH